MPDPEPYPAGVLITGGSGGIGAALCRRAAGAGWHVWIGYNSAADRAERLAAAGSATLRARRHATLKSQRYCDAVL